MSKFEELKAISKDVKEEVMTNPREALLLAMDMNVVTSWMDDGHFYNISFFGEKPVRVRKYQAAEYVIDMILDNFAGYATAYEPEEPLNYDNLKSNELSELLKERGLPYTGTKQEKIKRLEENDK